MDIGTTRDGAVQPGSPEAIAQVQAHEVELAEARLRAARRQAELDAAEPLPRIARALERIADLLEARP